MKIDGTPYRSVWVDEQDGWSVRIFDQTRLPWSLDIIRLTDVAAAAHAIRSMQVRGAPLIGAVGAYVAPVEYEADGTLRPGNLREAIRHAGPTFDLPVTFGI